MKRFGDRVVLLHGTGRTPRSLRGLEKRLQRAGFQTHNQAYPWRRLDIVGLANYVADALDAEGIFNGCNRLHFVTHSMGGLVAACLLGRLRSRIPVEVGRVVMLGPPLRGSEVADALSGCAAYKWLYGPAGQDLTTRSALLEGIRPDYALGVIAGTVGWPYPSGVLFIRGAHDGRVSVERTQWQGMKDHIRLPVTHSFMPSAPLVHHQVLHFIETGSFDS
jgi:pimeloyl-ACP methyl ester carboxylesterase